MVKRAKQDYAVRKQLLAKKKKVFIPIMSWSEQFFWEVTARLLVGYTPEFVYTKEPLASYTLDKGACIAYSGGLESSVIRYMWPHLPVVNYGDAPFDWTDPIEGSIAIYAAGLGYQTCFFGSELDDGTLLRDSFSEESAYYFFETTPKFAELWRSYSRADFLSPFSVVQRSEVFDIALREGVEFNSCFSNSAWCGKCFKCHQVHGLYLSRGIAPPFSIVPFRKVYRSWRKESVRELKKTVKKI